VLYIPRGHWHVALATEKPSLHLTVGINSHTGIDFLGWLKDELSEFPLWRQEFLQSSIQENSTGLSHFQALKNDLITFLEDPNVFRKYLISKVASDKNLSPFNFPSQFSKQENWTESTVFQFANYKKHIIVDEGENITLYCESKVIKLKHHARKAIEAIFELTSFTLNEILEKMANYNASQIIGIIRVLVENNLLFVK
jgi:ribosomal protein L16 Arg81 hydroxylase